MRNILFFLGAMTLVLSCTEKKVVQADKVSRDQALPRISCPCLYAQIFPYEEVSGERRIAVHVFNLADQAVQAKIAMTNGDQTTSEAREVSGSDRALVTFAATGMAPLERYEIRVRAWHGAAAVDSLYDVVRLSQFEIDHLVRLHLNL